MRRSILILTLAAATLAAGETGAAGPAAASWDKVRALVGDWTGAHGDGRAARVSYRLVSNGTAVMETLESAHDDQMVTVYHRDGESLFMTHYCSTGNQTRMRARGLEGARLKFSFVDASNVKGADEHVMTGLALTFEGPDRLVHEWTSKASGQEQTGRFVFVRRKAP